MTDKKTHKGKEIKSGLAVQSLFTTDTPGFPFTVITERGNSLYFVRQDGIIYEFKNGNSTTFLDIRSQVQYGAQQGLLGLAFNGDKKGHFFLWYTENELFGTPPSPTPPWVNRTTKFSHINRLEEWKIEKTGPIPLRTLLRIRHPFNDNNGVNNIFYDSKNRLILATGDGGSLAIEDGGDSFDPFNLAQNDNELFGKLLAIDIKDHLWSKLTPSDPVTQVSELGQLIQLIKVIGKGIRNPSRIDEKDGIKFLSVSGQRAMEYAFAFQSYKKNFGWRPIEGRVPTLGNQNQVVYPTEVFTLLDKNNIWMPIVSYANSGVTNLPSTVIQGDSITGVDIYRGKIKGLKDSLILTDLNGLVLVAKLPDHPDENELQIPRKVKVVNVQPLPAPLITTLFITRKNQILIGVFGASEPAQVVELSTE